MLCKKCQCEMRVEASEYVMEEQKLYLDHQLTCMNPQCEDFKKLLIVRHEVPFTNKT